MNLYQFLKLVENNFKLILIAALLTGTLAFIASSGGEKSYSSSTVIYTGLASGYNIESGKTMKFDYFMVNNAFDNLIGIIEARETLEEAGIRLLAGHLMLKKADSSIISEPHLQELHSKIPENLRKQVVSDSSFEQTVLNIYTLKKIGNNPIAEILKEEKSFYSFKTLSGASFKRKASSDLLEGSFESSDPGVCRQTLLILTDVFQNRYKALKEVETNSVVNYFEKETREANQRLQRSERELKDFMEDNKIINYYEQTKNISSKKEDLEEQLQQERLEYSSALAGIKRLEAQLDQRQRNFLQSRTILDLRNQLSSKTGKITLESGKNGADELKIAALQQNIDSLKTALDQQLSEYSSASITTEGVSLKQVLDTWLKNAIKIDQSSARMKVLENRQKEFEKTYARFAPLGSTINKLDRKINIVEQEYLQLLNSLNNSKIKQQNIDYATNLKMIDEPHYPLKPKPGKRGILVAGGTVAGGMLVLMTLLVLEFTDNTMKTVERARLASGLKVASGLPVLGKKTKIKYHLIENHFADLLHHDIHLCAPKNGRQYLIFFASTNYSEGKSQAMGLLARRLRQQNKKVLCFYNGLQTREMDEMDQVYTAGENFSEIDNWKSLTPSPVEPDPDYVLVEIPAIKKSSLPIKLIKAADKIYLTVLSKRVWSESDKNALNRLREASKIEPSMVLNGTKAESLEPLIGEIPKDRSYLRKRIKRFLKKDFSI